MPARAEGLELQPHHQTHAHLLRRLLAPAVGWAAFAAVIAVIRRVTREPSVSRMSDQWLASQHHDVNPSDY